MLRSFLGTLVTTGAILWYASSAASSGVSAVQDAANLANPDCEGKGCAPLKLAKMGVLAAADLSGSDTARSKDGSQGRSGKNLLAGEKNPPSLEEGPGEDARPPRWVTQPPPDRTQKHRTSEQRGINPCWAPDPGFGNYGAWDYSPSFGQMLVPNDLKLSADGTVPIMFHFHGHEPIRKEWVQAVDDAVLVALDLGVNSGPYLRKFAQPEVFEYLLASVERGLSQRMGEPVKAGKVGVSSWSAGYGAVQRILESDFATKVDAVILLDGLHTGHTDTERARVTLAPFVRFARRAAKNEVFMHVSHSSILPPGYASTTETASYLIWQLGGKPESAGSRADDPMGLELFRQYAAGGFEVAGYSGNGKLDHCAQLGVYRDVIRSRIAPRWGLSSAR